MEYNGYKVGDIIHYDDKYDESVGVIQKITRHKITINWEWAWYPIAVGLDILEHDDFDDLAMNFKKISEQEKLAIIIRNS